MDNREFNIEDLLRKPVFVPESASLEKVLLLMQETANHLVFVVDEFGNVDGIATLEDIIEEVVGEIQDEYDAKLEDWVKQVKENVYVVKGRASVKNVNQRLFLELPERKEYTTLAGFFLHEFGRIPQGGDTLEYESHQFFVEQMSRNHINLLRVILKQKKDEGESNEDHLSE